MRAAVLASAVLIAAALFDRTTTGRIHAEDAGVMIGMPPRTGPADQRGGNTTPISPHSTGLIREHVGLRMFNGGRRIF